MIHSRQMKIVDFVDTFTRKAFETKQQRTFAMIKPDITKGQRGIGQILTEIQARGFTISNLRLVQMTKQVAHQFYAEHKVNSSS